MYQKNMFLLCIVGLISFLSSGCQDNKMFNDPVNYIIVEEWESGDEIQRIDEDSVINEIIEEITSAPQGNVANLDIPLPDYKLNFFNADDNLTKELGYYTEEMNFDNTIGRYIDMDSGLHYGANYELSLENY